LAIERGGFVVGSVPCVRKVAGFGKWWSFAESILKGRNICLQS